MKLLWLYLMAYLALPIIGEVSLWYLDIHITAGDPSLGLIYRNIIFVLIILILSYYLQKSKRTTKQIRYFDYAFSKRVFLHAIIILLFLLFLIFVMGGYKIIFGDLNRGEVRSGLGGLGPLFTLALSYLPIAIIVYVSTVYKHIALETKQKLKKKLIIIFGIAILMGVVSGYKSVAVTLMIPGITVLYFDKLTFGRLMKISAFVVILLILFTTLVRHIGISEASGFFIYRITTMTAYGTIGVWNHFPDAASFSDILINYIGIFGAKISSMLLGIPQDDPEFLKTNLSRLITYMVYPATREALDNSVNVTVTNFGHALYLFGRNFYFIYAIIMGTVIGLLLRQFKKYVLEGYPFSASLIGLYIFAVVIPSINSGGVFQLISIPVLIYLLFTYFIVKYLIQGKIYVS